MVMNQVLAPVRTIVMLQCGIQQSKPMQALAIWDNYNCEQAQDVARHQLDGYWTDGSQSTH